VRLPLTFVAVCAGLAAAPAVKLLHVKAPMRDGVRLAANVFLPGELGRYPAILQRTPYGKGDGISENDQAFVARGYAMVVQDVRGRYESEGVFEPLTQEGQDGDDTINWIARQSWSNGVVGMTGGSYRGIVQWKAALRNNPHLKAIFPIVSGWDDYRDRFYSTGGAMKLGNRLLWIAENLKLPEYKPDFARYVLQLPVRSADLAAAGQTTALFQKAVEHPAYDSFWKSVATRERIGDIRIPVFSVGGWYDNFVESDLDAFAATHSTSPANRILIGPWAHNMSYKLPGADFGADSQTPIRALQLAWFDRWLKGIVGEGSAAAPVRVFVMGANRWREEGEWPPAGAKPVTWYIDSRGRANSLKGDGRLKQGKPKRSAPDSFVFDPYDATPTIGGAVCCNPNVFPWGPMDQRMVEARSDVLVYTSPPLRQALEVVGPVRVTLYVSTGQRDADFTAKLVDVFPDGRARNLTDGILRLRYRNSIERPESAVPGEVYRISIDAGVTANAFLKGHRIRLEIAGGNFPRFDRNAGDGGANGSAVKLLKNRQMVYHDKDRPSDLTMLVAPAVKRQAGKAAPRPSARGR
jgi:uncharacterized protein